MSYWINTISLDHVQRGMTGGFTQSNHGKPQGLKRLKKGDWLVFYSPKTSYVDGEPLQAFTAIGRISDAEPYQVEMTPDFKPFRRNMTFETGHQAPIKPLIDGLEFIADKTRWGYKFRFGLFEIGEQDFRLIAAAMGVSF